MGRWRTKLLWCLIVYGAGFATAVYVLAPSPDAASNSTEPGERYMWSKLGTEEAGFSSQDWAVKMRTGIDRVVSFAEENAVKGIRAVKAQMDQKRQHSGQ